MAKANAILFNSVLWNLREITKLEEKIKKHSGDVECASWRYPLTDCSQLEIFKLIENNKSPDSYTFVLELTYDRLLYLFNLVIKYLESEDPSEKFRPEKSVVRPKTLSLASVLHMLWDRIRFRKGNSFSDVSGDERKTKSEISGSKTSIHTQSEVYSISGCSSCQMVQDFVTRLVLEMERISEEREFASAIVEERKLMKENLAEATNWSAMSRWLTAILKDFDAVLEKAEEGAVASRKLRRRLDSDERKTKAKMEYLEEEARKLNALLRERDLRIQEMNKEIGDSITEKSQMSREIAAKNLQITRTTSNLELKIIEMKKNYDEKLIKVRENHSKKQHEKEIEWKKAVEFEKRLRTNLEIRVEELEKNVRESNARASEKTNALSSRVKGLESENKNLKEENCNLRFSADAKQKIIDEYSSKMLKAFPELNLDSKPGYKASGNPRVDMESQIDANKLRVELLLKENEKLQSILEKLEKMES